MSRWWAAAEPIVTGAEMRAAEAAAIASGTSAFALMQRAGVAAADAVAAYCGPAPTLVLTGPGNNGGDGYVVAQTLAARGWPVRVAALAPPATDAARAAAAGWAGPVESIATARPARILVDALFGTGLTRPLDATLVEAIQRLAAGSIAVALDLPSGAATDDGACLSPLVACSLTVTFGALKPSHLLYPAAASMGRVVIADIGLGAINTALVRNAAPERRLIDPAAHKYARGHVLVAAGAMPGAASLAARAAQRGGAGYVTLASESALPPSSLVVRPLESVDAAKVDAVVMGPGLGRDAAARERAERLLSLGKPAVLDADLFTLFAGTTLLDGRNDVMMPHEGEFSRYFSGISGNKVDRARTAAARSGNVVVLKGADTVIAAPDGRAAINGHASPRLATAGSGDVLAGLVAAHLAAGDTPFEAACAAVWRHGDAALRGRDGLVAEDLIELIR
jgi:hydroxyethylthiazole kinase-like uncharacterized protein yjeF